MSDFDLFAGLSSLSKGNMNWYKSLSPEAQKQAHPYVIARWMVGTSDVAQLIRINTFVNPYLFTLPEEKDLLFKLLAASATGNTYRYKWMKPPGSSTAKISAEVVSRYYDVTLREGELYLFNHDSADVMEMAEALGYDKDELTKLKKELGDGSGTTEKSSRGKKTSKR